MFFCFIIFIIIIIWLLLLFYLYCIYDILVIQVFLMFCNIVIVLKHMSERPTLTVTLSLIMELLSSSSMVSSSSKRFCLSKLPGYFSFTFLPFPQVSTAGVTVTCTMVEINTSSLCKYMMDRTWDILCISKAVYPKAWR